MPLNTSSSSFIQVLDTKIVSDLCLGFFNIDVSPSTFAVNGATHMKGGKVKILDLNHRVIKDYSNVYDFGSSGNPITQVYRFQIPKVAGQYVYGTYTVSVSVTDNDNRVFELSKSAKISYPDLSNPINDLRILNAVISASPKDGNVRVIIDAPISYSGSPSRSISADIKVKYPEASGQPDANKSVLDFTVGLYDGVYDVSGTACVLYGGSDNVFTKVPHLIHCTKDIIYTVDFLCVYEKLAELNAEIQSEKCKDKDLLSSIVLEALFSLRSAELAAGVSQDPSIFIHRLNYLLGIPEAGPTCNNRVSIINSSKGQHIDGVCAVTNLSDGSLQISYPSTQCDETIMFTFDKAILGRYDDIASYFDNGEVGVKTGLASVTQNVVHRLIDVNSGDYASFKRTTSTFNGVVREIDKVVITSKSGQLYSRVGPFNASWWGFGVSKTKDENTLALQSAINVISSLGGGELNIDSGEYRHYKVIMRRRVVLVGQGNGHASVYFTDQKNRVGTVLLIDGQAGDDCIQFEVNTSFSGMRDISIYNDNSNGIRSVVNITGVLYPSLYNVEISSRLHAASGVKTYGLLMKGNLVPNSDGQLWDSLYVTLVNVNVITNETVGVSNALGLIGVAVASRPNAVRFIGGHFQGYRLSCEIDATAPNSKPQGVAFLGTTFESYFNAEQQLVYVPNSIGFNAFSDGVNRYAVIWMKIGQANQVIFTGCYFENGGVPFDSLDDGTHGAHASFPMIWLTSESTQIDLSNGNTLVGGVFDQGYGNRTPNKISFLDQYGISFIQAGGGEIGTSTSQVEIGSMGAISARFRGSSVLINTNHYTEGNLQVEGLARIAGVIKYIGLPGIVRSKRFLTVDPSDDAIKFTDTHNGITSVDDITIAKIGGCKIVIGNENNSMSLGCDPDDIGLGVHGVLKVEGVLAATIKTTSVTFEKQVVVKQSLKAETPAPNVNDTTVATTEWVKFQSWIPKLTKVNRDLLTGLDDSYMVYVTDGGGYYSYYKGGAWFKFTETAD